MFKPGDVVMQEKTMVNKVNFKDNKQNRLSIVLFSYEENNKLDEEATQASAVASGTNGQISVFGSDAGNKFIKHSSEDIYKELFELKDYDTEEEHNIYTCMDCGNEFEDSQVYITDADGNPSCPFCRSGDVSKYED